MKNTTIPVPHIHGFGPASAPDEHNPTGLAYIILDYIPGRSLDLLSLLQDSRPRRGHFYSQLFEILGELRRQEFDRAGSLMLDPDGGPAPVLGPSLSLQLNELQVERGAEDVTTGTFHSTADFASHQFHLLDQKYRLPVSDMSARTAQLEVFGLNDMKNRIPKIVSTDDRGPFVLAHADLRWSNIIVDEHLTIRGIIDWEWASTIPRQSFVPPTWIAGRAPEWVTGIHYRNEYRCFYYVLQAKAATSEPCQQLLQEWGSDLHKQVRFVLAVMLRHHNHFLALYYKGIFPQFYKTPLDESLNRFFERDGDNGSFTLDLRQRLKNSERYTQYLKVNDLVVPRSRLININSLALASFS